MLEDEIKRTRDQDEAAGGDNTSNRVVGKINTLQFLLIVKYDWSRDQADGAIDYACYMRDRYYWLALEKKNKDSWYRMYR